MANGAYRTSELPQAANMAPSDRVVILFNAAGNLAIGNGSPGTRTIPLTKLIDSGMPEVFTDFAAANSVSIGNSTSNVFVNSSSLVITNISGTTFSVNTAGVVSSNGYDLTSIQANNVNGLATVAVSGSYNDLNNIPSFAVSAFLDTSNASNINTGSLGIGVTLPSTPTFAFYANTFSNIPGSPVQGQAMVITDANVTSGNITVGGGNNAVLAWYNGTNWRCIVD